MFESAAAPAEPSAPPVSVPRAARLLRLARDRAPGAAAVALLEQVDPGQLCAADRVDLLACWEAHEGWLLARRAAAVVAVAGAAPADDELDEDSARMQVAAAIRVTVTTAGHRVDTARFVHAHPDLAAALTAGRLGYGHLAVLERELAAAAAATVTAVLAEVLPAAADQTPSRLRQHACRALARIDADAVTDRIRAHHRNRSADLTPEPDLGARITVTGPWAMTAWAYRQFDAWARAERDRLRATHRGTTPGPDTPDSGPDTRDGEDGAQGRRDVSLTALRADAVVEAARLLALSLAHPDTDPHTDPHTGTGTDTTGDPDTVQPRRRGRSWSTAIVVCDLPTALGLADEPGHVPGYGPVPAPIARHLLAHADTWRRFLTTDSTLTDAGTTRYRPTDALRDLITARDQACAFPGCTVPATHADLDHTTPYDGTNTTPDNLRPLCRRHHRVKTHHPGWQLRTGPHGPEWTTPTGHRHHTPPEPLWQTTDRIITDRRRLGTLTRHHWQRHRP